MGWRTAEVAPAVCLSGGWEQLLLCQQQLRCEVECVCSLPGLYIEDEGVAFKNNIFYLKQVKAESEDN